MNHVTRSYAVSPNYSINRTCYVVSISANLRRSWTARRRVLVNSFLRLSLFTNNPWNQNMKRLTLLVVITLGALLPSRLPAQTPNDEARLREFENFVRMQMERDRIPGLTIGFLKGDQTWVKAFGFADVENKTPATENYAYRIASTTNTMTGLAIVQLAERGKIDLDAEIQTYLPEYPKQKWPVTARQLLTHLSGGQGPSG